MRSGSITRWKHFARYHECGRIRSKVLEEISEAEEEDEGAFAAARREHLLVAEAHADEEDGEHREAHELDRLSAP